MALSTGSNLVLPHYGKCTCERVPVEIFCTPCMYRLYTDVLGTPKTVSLRFDNVCKKNKV